MTEPERTRVPTSLRAQQEGAWLTERHEGHYGIRDLGRYAVTVPGNAVGAVAVEIDPHRIERDVVVRGQRRASVLKPLVRNGGLLVNPLPEVSRGSSTSRSYIQRRLWRQTTSRSSSSKAWSEPDTQPGQTSSQESSSSWMRSRPQKDASTTVLSSAHSDGCQATIGAIGELPTPTVVSGGIVDPIQCSPPLVDCFTTRAHSGTIRRTHRT
jgi:hypothetical protein